MRAGRRIVVIAGVLGLVASLLVGLSAAATPSWTIERVAGADRYATAVAVSNRVFPSGAATVVVASGEGFADALAATPAAARLQAPLLLSMRASVPSVVEAEIRRLHPERIVLTGGTAAVSAAVESRLAAIAPVRRLAGADRFATSVAVADGVFATGVPVAMLANGRTFPDALAAGNVAARLGGPVLLVERDVMPAVVRSDLTSLRPARLLIAGGAAAVSDAVVAGVEHDAIGRLSGPDRYATAAALVAAAPAVSPVGIVAAGGDYADALAGGPAAAALGGSLVLGGPSCLPTSEAQALADQGVTHLLVIGGTRALPEGSTEPCGDVSVPSTTSTSTSSVSTSTTAADGSGGGGGGSSSQPLPVLKVQGVLDTDAPDPAVLRVGDRWYAYSTQVGFTAVPVRWSDDLVTWSAPQDALPTLPVWASGGWNWAPSVVATDDGYVLWFVARDIASDRQCVSRAVATDPMGPFVDDSAEAPVCQADVGGSIDPDVFTDDDGQRYLTWKSDENAIGQRAQLWVAPLSADATTLTAPGQAVLAEDASWEVPTIEQPALVREGDIYYLFYSGGAWESDGYGIGYATGASPTGPFTKRTRTRAWVRSAAGRYGPGALDVFEGPAGARWAVFHAWPGRVGYAAGGWRSMRVGSLDLP